jgi:hypothetical protein
MLPPRSTRGVGAISLAAVSGRLHPHQTDLDSHTAARRETSIAKVNDRFPRQIGPVQKLKLSVIPLAPIRNAT